MDCTLKPYTVYIVLYYILYIVQYDMVTFSYYVCIVYNRAIILHVYACTAM